MRIACLAAALIVAAWQTAAGYTFYGPIWPNGSEIILHLDLNHAGGPLQDGFSSWNASATDAIALWNQYLDTVQFAPGAAVPAYGRDKKSSAFFSNTIYGEGFPSSVLAITLDFSSSEEQLSETDVIFNSNRTWDSYRGPQQQTNYDFHRVALHEFGHVLGLDHPDQSGQAVTAMMNSVISDLDHLASDDIAGVRSAYGLNITSPLSPPNATAGNPFSYQITANNNPSSFTASGLPAGLQLDTTSGWISGTPTTAGTFNVVVTAHGSPKDASATVRIVVIGPMVTSSLTPPSGSLDVTFSYQITANNNPTSFSATGLPPGLQLNEATGMISGTPTYGGTFNVSVTAHGQLDATATVRIIILGPTITSNPNPIGVAVGNNFSYQITSSKNSTSYAATGLPPGLQVDESTGLISGVPTISGTYSVTVFARGPYGEASTHITITFAPNPIPRPYDTPSFTLPVGSGPIVTDAARSRVYVASGASIAIVNTDPPQVVATIPVSGVSYVSGLAISRDEKILWFAQSVNAIGRIDLETLKTLADLSTNASVNDLREGLDNRLYAATSSGVLQLDATTGALQQTLQQYVSAIEISPDGTTLYVGQSFEKPTIKSYDISDASPALLKSNQPAGSNALMSLSPDGARLSFWTGPAITLYDAADIDHPLGLLPSPYYGYGQPVFAPDHSLVFQLATPAIDDPQIWVYDSIARQLVRTIKLPARSGGYRFLGVDGSNKYVMACPNGGTAGGPALLFYPIVPQVPTIPPHSLLNVSTRLRTQGGDDALIGGFIINGQEPKQIAVRAMGPSLPVAGKLADPVLQLFDGTGALVAQNDNWNSHRTDVLATGIPPSDEHEAVISATLPPGSYTGVVRGVNDNAGVALIEAYDLSAGSDSRLANISTRGKVEAGDNVMIGGFILGGGETTSVVVRAIGPSLSNFGVGGALTDPMLEVYNGNGTLLAQDDDWRQYQEASLLGTGLSPSDDHESAMLLVLEPGAYTAVVRGKDNGTGVGLVEVYNLDAN